MSDLMPCRFCGAAPHAWLDDYINGRIVPDPYYIIECENAGCSVYPEVRGIWPYMDEVRSMWNSANPLNTGKEVMPDAVQSPPARHDIGPGDQGAVAGAALEEIGQLRARVEDQAREIADLTRQLKGQPRRPQDVAGHD